MPERVITNVTKRLVTAISLFGAIRIQPCIQPHPISLYHLPSHYNSSSLSSASPKTCSVIMSNPYITSLSVPSLSSLFLVLIIYLSLLLTPPSLPSLTHFPFSRYPLLPLPFSTSPHSHLSASRCQVAYHACRKGYTRLPSHDGCEGHGQHVCEKCEQVCNVCVKECEVMEKREGNGGFGMIRRQCEAIYRLEMGCGQVK